MGQKPIKLPTISGPIGKELFCLYKLRLKETVLYTITSTKMNANNGQLDTSNLDALYQFSLTKPKVLCLYCNKLISVKNATHSLTKTHLKNVKEFDEREAKTAIKPMVVIEEVTLAKRTICQSFEETMDSLACDFEVKCSMIVDMDFSLDVY